MKFPPKIANRKTKCKTNKGGITQPNINDSLEITKLDSSIISEGKIASVTPQIQAFTLQKAAAGVWTVPKNSFVVVKPFQRLGVEN